VVNPVGSNTAQALLHGGRAEAGPERRSLPRVGTGFDLVEHLLGIEHPRALNRALTVQGGVPAGRRAAARVDPAVFTAHGCADR
jgi:hypothetical protein